MKSFTKMVIFALAAVSLTSAAYAQCPAQPLSTLAGTWVFQTEGVSWFGAASVGKFTATVGTDFAGQPQGQLKVIESSNFAGPGGNGLINRFLAYQGIFTIFPDCSGGTLMFNSNFNLHLQYDFYFRTAATGLEIVMVSISGPRFFVPVRQVISINSIQTNAPAQQGSIIDAIIGAEPVFNGTARKIS